MRNRWYRCGNTKGARWQVYLRCRHQPISIHVSSCIAFKTSATSKILWKRTFCAVLCPLDSTAWYTCPGVSLCFTSLTVTTLSSFLSLLSFFVLLLLRSYSVWKWIIKSRRIFVLAERRAGLSSANLMRYAGMCAPTHHGEGGQYLVVFILWKRILRTIKLSGYQSMTRHIHDVYWNSVLFQDALVSVDEHL